MKILIALVVIIAVVWLIRAARKDTPAPPGQKPPARPEAASTAVNQPLAMLQCLHCGVHLPGDDVVKGRQGAYCTEAHRQLAER